MIDQNIAITSFGNLWWLSWRTLSDEMELSTLEKKDGWWGRCFSIPNGPESTENSLGTTRFSGCEPISSSAGNQPPRDDTRGAETGMGCLIAYVGSVDAWSLVSCPCCNMRSLRLVSGSNSDSGTSPSSLAGELCKLDSEGAAWPIGFTSAAGWGNCTWVNGIIDACAVGGGTEPEDIVYWREVSLGSRLAVVTGIVEAADSAS